MLGSVRWLSEIGREVFAMQACRPKFEPRYPGKDGRESALQSYLLTSIPALQHSHAHTNMHTHTIMMMTVMVVLMIM